MSDFHAHTTSGECSTWEPLFTPECEALSGGFARLAKNLERFHDHLNKVAWWAAQFAEETFAKSNARGLKSGVCDRQYNTHGSRVA